MSVGINHPENSVFGQFAQIEAAKNQLASTTEGVLFRKVELGEISTQDGRKFGVVIGNFSYPARLDNYSFLSEFQPRVARMNRDWVVAVEDQSEARAGLKPIAYAADLAELPGELRDRLVERVVEAPDRLVAEVEKRNARERAIVEAPLRYDDSAVRSNKVA